MGGQADFFRDLVNNAELSRQIAEAERIVRVRDCATIDSNAFDHFLATLKGSDAAKLTAVRSYEKNRGIEEGIVESRTQGHLLVFGDFFKSGVRYETDSEALTRKIDHIKSNIIQTCAKTR